MSVKVKFLNEGDFETDVLITDFGKKLLSFALNKQFNTEVLDTEEQINFIDASIVSIIHDIKTDLIALHALQKCNVGSVEIDLGNSSSDVVYSFYKQALDKEVIIRNYPLKVSLKFGFRTALQQIKLRLYLFVNTYRKQGSKIDSLPENGVGSEKRILFESNYVNSMHTLLPLIKELSPRYQISFTYLLLRRQAFKYMESIGIKNITLINPIDFGHINTANLRKFSDEFLNEYFSQTAPGYFKEVFFKVLRRNLAYCLSLYLPLKNKVAEYKPHAIVLCTGSSVDARLLIQIAKRNQILDYVLVHGLLSDSPVLSFNNTSVKFVWSEHQAQMMKKYAPAVKAIVTGSPKHTQVKSNLDNGTQKRIIEDRYILYATTPPNNVLLGQRDYEVLLKSFAEVSRQFENLKFVVKLHPSESISQVKDLLHQIDGIESKVIIFKDEDIYNLLYFSEMVMVVSSTTGFEAIYFEKPLIIYETAIKAFHYPFKNENFVKVVNTTASLAKAIEDNISKGVDKIPSDLKAKYFLDNPSATTDILNIVTSGNQ